jgi:glycerate-2-kinase
MTKIKNKTELTVTPLREDLMAIVDAGLDAIDTRRAIRRLVCVTNDTIGIGGDEYPISKYKNIVVIGVGKCASDAAQELGDVLGDHLTGGVIIDIKAHITNKKLTSFQGTHPLPSPDNVRAARAIVETISALSENDLVIAIVSGGGSTMLCLPEDGTCDEEASIIETLMRRGATIEEMNTVRKHLSRARGGFLAQYAYPASVVSLIFSDVPGDNMEFVASGPTIRDTTTIADAMAVLEKYDVLATCNIQRCGLLETPKDEKYFKNVRNILAVSSAIAISAMANEARVRGYVVKTPSERIQGQARIIGSRIAKEINDAPDHTALLYSGETTVVVHGHGEGGRNLEAGLAAIKQGIAPNSAITFLASDGHDHGMYAGLIADQITIDRIKQDGIDINVYLENNNEYPLLHRIGQYIETGDTGSNVSDLIIAIKK